MYYKIKCLSSKTTQTAYHNIMSEYNAGTIEALEHKMAGT